MKNKRRVSKSTQSRPEIHFFQKPGRRFPKSKSFLTWSGGRQKQIPFLPGLTAL